MIELIAIAGLFALGLGVFFAHRDDREWDFTIGVTSIIIGIILGIIGIAALLTRAECRAIATRTERETRWDIFAGCFVHLEGEWFPSDQMGDVRLRGEIE